MANKPSEMKRMVAQGGGDENEALQGSYEELLEGDSSMSDTKDGGAEVDLGDGPAPAPDQGDFYNNLALTLDSSKLNEVAEDLYKKVDHDMQSHQKRVDKYSEALRRTGLSEDAPGGASFVGASRVVHPMLTKATIDFESRAMKEIFPASGPVKSHIVGEVTKERWEKAGRKAKYLNWQLTQQMLEFRDELEQALTQTAIAGVSYIRFVWDGRFRRPTSKAITLDMVPMPYAATSFYGSERINFIEDITEMEYRDRVRDQAYSDVDIMPSLTMVPDPTKVKEQQDKIAGKTPASYNTDGLRRTVEVNTYLSGIDSSLDEGPLPYLVTLDWSSRKVLGLVRNWEQDDKKFERMHWLVEVPFVPWEGATRVGFAQLIGGLSGGATGSLRALLDSAYVNNMPTALKLKGAQSGGQSKVLQPTEMLELDGGVGAEDIRKLVMPIPYNQPSPVLFQLLGFLVDAGSDMVRTTFDNMASDGSNPAQPVGTTMALIEQGLVVVSNIMGRMHKSMAMILRVLHRIDRMYLDEAEVKADTGEILVKREDLDGPLDVIPVSDPGVPSDSHRFAQTQAIMQRAITLPQIYDLRKVERRFLETMRIQNPDDLLNPVPEPQDMNAANENAAMALGRPVSAFPTQDHLAHIQTHTDFAASPIFGMLPIIAPAFLPAFLGHLKEHMVLWYVNEVYNVTSEAAGRPVDEFMKFKDDSVKTETERLIAQASPDVIETAMKKFAKLPPIIQQAIEMAKQFQPQPQDPNAAANMARVKVEETRVAQDGQLKREANQMKAQDLKLRVVEGDKDRQLELQRLAASQQTAREKEQGEGMRSASQIQSDQAIAQASNVTKEKVNVQDNVTALTIANAEIESGEKVAVSKGTGLNPGS